MSRAQLSCWEAFDRTFFKCKNTIRFESNGVFTVILNSIYPLTKSALIMSLAIPGFSFKRRVE
jgi:hypothetical protein